MLVYEFKIGGIPVVDNQNKLKGIVTNRDLRFEKELNKKVNQVMTTKNLITANEDVDLTKAEQILQKHKIEKLPVIDKNHSLVGLITFKDIIKVKQHPFSCKDSFGRLRVAAAVGVSNDTFERIKALVKSGTDAIVIDTAHGHSKGVITLLKKVKKQYPNLDVVVGNIATGEAALDLVHAGADGVKVGIGPGSICTTRIVTGVGIPQLSAVIDAYKVAKKYNIPVIADGGIKTSGDIAKAIAGGASACMIGSLLAGTDESPGKMINVKGNKYKSYRGMGSVGAMQKGSFDRYSQEETKNAEKLVAEGVEGMVPFKGKAKNVVYQLVGGVKSSMGYTGHKTIKKMQNNCKFVFISKAGARESNVHDVLL